MPRSPGGGRPRPGARRSGSARERGREHDAGTRPRAVERGLGGQIVAGRNSVRELLAAGRRPVREVFFAEGIDPAPVLDDIASLAAKGGVPIRIMPRARLEQLAETEAPQGVVARAAALPEADLATLASPTRPGGPPPFLVALDGVTDPHNLGAIIRTAESAGATGLVLTRHRAAHVTPTVTKAAAGAIEYLPIAVVPGLPAALQELQSRGVWTVGLAGDAAQTVFDLPVADGPVCLVLGSEGAGLSRLVRQRCELVVGIPRVGHTESLNVSAAAAVTCFEIARRRMTDSH
ncbi:MAG TPA: 23S rRNA (guanosine(2251)-2'-O)-methyltransferase RlmB [Acidimicrobiales bacterium]|nr:23S rRNA (guanosine(2251)-2'-O)-methyltransferase RlmB [Acidimicrobiales bacterium]